MSRRDVSQAGMATLELSIVVLATLFILLGLVDASNVLRARSALNEAARLAVRHLSTTSGGASSKTADARKGRYTWTLYQPEGQSRIVATSASATAPAECETARGGAYCERRFESFDGNADKLFRGYMPDYAQSYVVQELGAAFPRIQGGDCAGEKYCLQVQFLLPGEDGRPADSDIEIALTYQVPLLLMFGGGSVPVTVRSSMQQESQFINRTPTITMTNN